MADNEEDAASYETEHVHAVYDQIATHFSSTRYKPWPIIERFLRDLTPGSIGVDVGCGNGKYLAVNHDVFIVGSDRSPNLTEIANTHEPHDAIVADALSLPHPRGNFDFAISIAVIHHLATPSRRVDAISNILALLGPSIGSGSIEGTSEGTAPISKKHCVGGRALIYVWALEQKDSRRGWDTGDKQDVMVPWVLKGKQRVNKKSKRRQARSSQGDTETAIQHVVNDSNDPEYEQPEDQVFHRYYHLYCAGELERDIQQAGGKVLESGYEKDNWWAIACSSSHEVGMD